MFRRDLIELLKGRERRLHELARERQVPPAELEDDLQHLLRSLKYGNEYRAYVTPKHCRHCGSTFRHDRLGKPSRCPCCRHSWIEAPRIAITALTPP